MRLIEGRLTQSVARSLGLPPGTGELLNRSARVRLLSSLIGSLVLAVLEMLGVLATLPLMQYIAGIAPTSGALGRISGLLGHPREGLLLFYIACGMVVVFVVKDVVSVLFRRWQLHFMAEQEATMSTEVLRGYLVGPYAWHLAKSTGDKVFTVEAAMAMGFAGGLGAALSALTEMVTITLIIVGMALVSPVTTALCLVYFGLGALVIQRFVRPRIIAASERTSEMARETGSAALQALGGVKEIKLRNASERFVGRYQRARLVGAHARASAALLSDLPKYILEIMFISAMGLIAVVAAAGSSREQLVVTLGVFVAAGTRIVPSAVRLLAAFSGMKFARAPLAHLVSTRRMQRMAEWEASTAVRTQSVPRGDIVVDDVHFAYADQPGVEVLAGVDLTIPAGRSVALVGSSGAGKTTLVDIILGLHVPTRGSVRAGGIDIADNIPAWQRQLAVVPQDVYLMDESLAQNIAFEQEIDRDRLSEVVGRAQLTDLVKALPDGLDSEVGERGARISGGQRQRVGIARALYRRPDVLVLDEATSALDNETERRLTDTIQSLRGSVTMVIVAHRLSTVRHCDQIVFMSRGRVVSVGTFDELAASTPEFANLVRLGTLTPAGASALDG